MKIGIKNGKICPTSLGAINLTMYRTLGPCLSIIMSDETTLGEVKTLARAVQDEMLQMLTDLEVEQEGS